MRRETGAREGDLAMDDAILTKLRDIAATYGPGVFEDSRRVEALLRDLSGDRRREIAVLVAAMREGVPAELLAFSAMALPSVTRERLVRILKDYQGLAEEAAAWAVNTWASALGVAVSLPAGATTQATRAVGGPGPADAQIRAARVDRLVNSATQVTTSMREKNSRASALACLATILIQTDRDRAAAYMDEAVSFAESTTDRAAKAYRLHALSTTLAAADPDRAERLAQSIPFTGLLKDDALGCLAQALIGTDPDRALRLAWSITDENLKGYELAGLAIGLAATEPDRAERVARSLPANYWKAEALTGLAATLAATDPDRAVRLLSEAERLARSLTDEDAGKASVLSSIGKALATADSDRAGRLFDEAERLAGSLIDEAAKEQAMGSISAAVATADPDRALRLAQSVTDGWYTLGEIAKALASSEPDRALSLAQAITTETPHLCDVAAALARTDPDGALRLAWSLKGERLKASALVGIARTLAAMDPGRTARLLDDVERLAQVMTDDLDKVRTLVDVAAAWSPDR
jgi:hypothetical protein